MNNYIKNFDNYSKKIVYCFYPSYGGIGDYVKYFMISLVFSINFKYRLYFLINNNNLEKYIKLKHTKMYIKKNNIQNYINIAKKDDLKKITNNYYYIVHPQIFHKENTNQRIDFTKINIKFGDVFTFSNEILLNRNKILSPSINNYISIHLRLGDKHLETDKKYIIYKDDERIYNEQKIYNIIEENSDKNILFFCDNYDYKIKIKNKYNNIIITDSDIGHTSLSNTSCKQYLDAITDYYILTNSEKIIRASRSGFSLTAAKFKNIELIDIF